MAIITSADLASFMGIGDTNDDSVLTIAAAAANRTVSDYCGRTFDKTAIVDASARTFRPGLTECRVDDFWETSALVVKADYGDDGTYETTLTLNADYFLEPLNGQRHGQAVPYYIIKTSTTRTFPTGLIRPAVQVTAAWGWTVIPPAVKLATLLMGAKLARRKDSPEGVLGGWSEFGAVRISRHEDPDVVSLLHNFERPETARLA